MRPCLTGRWPTLAAAMACPDLARALAAPAAPLLELRLDLMGDTDDASVRRAVAHFGPRRLVLTCRHPAAAGPAGGRAAVLSDRRRRALWRLGHALGIAYLDVDAVDWLADAALRAALLAPCAGQLPCHVVVSSHDFAGVPPLAALWRAYCLAANSGAALVKWAGWADDAAATWPLLALQRAVARARRTPGWGRAHGLASPQDAPPLLAFAMGPGGVASRLLCGRQLQPPPFGYVACTAAGGTAAGQPTLAEWTERYAATKLTATTPVYGVAGWPLAHSQSPRLHNAVLRHFGRAGLYLPFPLATDLGPFVARMAPHLGLRGLSVTLPHKGAAALLAPSDAVGTAAGASNTLWRTAGGAWQGANTDGPALQASLEHKLGASLAGRRCLVLGTGGTAAVALAALRAAGAKTAVWGRRQAASQALGQRFAATAVAALPQALTAALAHAEVVVHCTPVGMAPNVAASLLSARQLRQLPAHALVFDAIYTPAQTQLLRRARAAGRAVLAGRGMFLRQAQAQCRAFYRRAPPLRLLAELAANET